MWSDVKCLRSRNPHHLHASYYAMLMARQAKQAKQAKQAPKDGLVFVEVGVDEGDFFAAVVQEMDWLGVDVKYYAVDPWFGRIEQMKNALNLAIKWAPKVWIIRETGDKASRMLEDESVDFVFIDAVHTFEYVTLHMEKFWPKVGPGFYQWILMDIGWWFGGFGVGRWVCYAQIQSVLGMDKLPANWEVFRL